MPDPRKELIASLACEVSSTGKQLLADMRQLAATSGGELPGEAEEFVVILDRWSMAYADVIADKVAMRLKAGGVGV